MDRWRGGAAAAGKARLEIQLAGSMIYAVDAVPEGETQRRAA
jgi:hypothetical protein